MTIKSPGLYRAVQIIRSLLYFALFASIVFWIRGAQTLEPWTVLLASVIAILEAVNLVQQFQPNAAVRRSRQLESLILQLKQAPGAGNYIEPIVSYLGSEEQDFDAVTRVCAHFVVTGVSGAGKTTILQQKAVKLAEECLGNIGKDLASPLPFLVYLSQWRSGTSLNRFLKEQWPYDGEPIQLIATANVWFLADGLDELTGDVSRKMGELRRWLDSGTAPYRAIFTCRSDRYSDNLALPLPEVTLPPELSTDQVTEFANRYLGKGAAEFLAIYTYECPEWAREATQSLTLRTPLVLTVLLRAFKSSSRPKALQNPGVQVDIYLREVWERELLRHSSSQIPFEEMLTACARFMQRGESRRYVHGNQSLSERETINALAHGLLNYAHHRRNARRRNVHTVLVVMWMPIFLILFVIRIIAWLLIAILFHPIRSLRIFTIKSQGVRTFVRSFASNTVNTLDEIVQACMGIYRELRKMDFRTFVSGWPDYYFETDMTIDYWRARHRSQHLLVLLLSARIIRKEHKSYEAQSPLVGKYLLAQEKRLAGAATDLALLSWNDDPNWVRRNPYYDTDLVMLSGIAENPEEFVAKLSLHDPYAATLCAASGIEIGPLTREVVVDNLLELLLRLLRARDYDWRLPETYRALQFLSDPSIVEPLLDTVGKFGHYNVANDIIEIVVGIGRNALPALIRCLPTCEYSGRRVVITSLGRIADPRGIKPLREWMMTDPAEEDVIWALAALSHLGEVDARERIINSYLLNPTTYARAGDYHERYEPWFALWETTPNYSRTLDDLLDILRRNSERDEVHDCFERLLTRRGPAGNPLDGQLVEAYRREGPPVVKRTIARVLAERKVTGACDAFIADIYDPELVRTLIPALGQLSCDKTDVIQALVGYLQDPDPGIRWRTLEALGELRPPSAALPMSRLLSDSTMLPHRRQLCEIAAENLCKIDSPIAREKASAYYLEQLRKLTPDSCEWGDLEFRLKGLNHDDRAEIDRIRREIVSQHDIIPEPQLEPVT